VYCYILCAFSTLYIVLWSEKHNCYGC
jgi:hypothetical protein